MVSLMDKATISAEIEASCAICGAPPFPECPHEGKSLELAIDQAQARWTGLQEIRYFRIREASFSFLVI